MLKKIVFRFSLIFMISTIAFSCVFLTLSLLADFFISGLPTIPVIVYVVYAIGSFIVAIISYFLRSPRKFVAKRFFLGLSIWILLSVLMILGFLIIANWASFYAQLKELISVEFLEGFAMALILFAFSGLATWCLSRRKKQQKSDKS